MVLNSASIDKVNKETAVAATLESCCQRLLEITSMPVCKKKKKASLPHNFPDLPTTPEKKWLHKAKNTTEEYLRF